MLWLGIFLLGYSVLRLATMSVGHAWGDDWAQFVLHARNIVTGHPYADTGYLFNPDVPNIGPPSYPPGLPLLLAPIVALFGINILAFKVVCFASLVLALLVAFRVLSTTVGKTEAFIAILLFALHPSAWGLGQSISSEPLFLLFSMMVLLWAGRPEKRDGNSSIPIGTGVFLGLLLFCSVISRSIGMSLLPALLVYGWAQRKPFAWFAGLIAAFLILIWLQTHWLVKPTTYENELVVPSIGLILANANGYWLALADLIPLPFGMSRLTPLVVGSMSAIGALSILTPRCPAGQSVGGVRAVAARVPVVLWFLAAYLLALHLVSIPNNSRYLLPVMPIVIALAAKGFRVIVDHLPRPRRWLLTAGIALAAYMPALYMRPLPSGEGAKCAECLQMFDYVREHSSPGSVIVFMRPRAMALLGGRASWVPSAKYTLDELKEHLARLEAHIVVMATPGSDFARRFPASASLTARIREPDAQVVYRNGMFEVIRLDANWKSG